MNNVIKATRTEKGVIVHTLSNGETRNYAAVRGGIGWPLISENLPAYFCIYGEELIERTQFEGQNLRGRLCFLCESEMPDIATSLSTFFNKLTDAVILYGCTVLYTITEASQKEDYSGYAEAFEKFLYDRKLTVQLTDAPWYENPDLGIHHIREWQRKGLLEILEDSLIRAQLQTLQPETVKTLPETLNAVNGLRFLVSGFEKYKPSNTSSNWQKHVRQGSWRV